MFRVLATSSVALFAAAAPVLAEVTPAEVWGHMVKQYESLGYTVAEGSREEAGDTLTLTDAVLTMDGEVSTSSITFPKLVLTQTGDGNVRWSIEEDITGQSIFKESHDGEAPGNVSYTISLEGDETVSSGSVEDLTHESTADSATITISQDMPDGGAMPMTFTLEDLSGKQRSVAVADNGGEETTFEANVAKVGMKADAEMPNDAAAGEAANSFTLDGTLEQLAVTGRMLIAAGSFNMEEQLSQSLAAGTDVEFALTHGAGSGSFDFAGTDDEGQQQTGNGTFGTGPGNLKVAMSKDGLHYSGSSVDGKVEVQLSSLPAPVAYAMAKGDFSVDFPLMAAEAAQKFNVLFAFEDLTLGDSVWALFDPESKLNRDPADLKVDVTGEVLLEEDLLQMPQPGDMPTDAAPAEDDAAAPAEGETETAEAPAEAAPDAAPEAEATAEADGDAAADATADATADANAEAADAMAEAMPKGPIPLSVTINDVSVNVLGAQAKVTGQIAAAEGSNLQETQIGAIDGRFVGVNALLDTLAAMGFVPEEQMMGARMMLAMFAKPVEGETDTLETKLEFREGGSIFANGQQVK